MFDNLKYYAPNESRDCVLRDFLIYPNQDITELQDRLRYLMALDGNKTFQR